MTSPILFLDAALAGMALTAGAISGLLVCVQRQWRPLGWFALISLLAAVYASLGALRGPGADVEAFVDMTRWQTLCSYLCAIFLIRLYDDLCGRVPGWPEGLLTAGYLVLVVAGTVRTMPIPWDSVEALGPVELGRWGSVYVPRVQVSRFMVPVRIFHVLALGYCAWMAWTARRSRPLKAMVLMSLPLLMIAFPILQGVSGEESVLFGQFFVAVIYANLGVAVFVQQQEQRRDIADRKRAELAIGDRMRFEQLIADLSATLAGSSADQVDEAIDQSLRSLAEFLAVDRLNVVELLPDRTGGRRTHSYAAAGVEPSPIEVMYVKELPWYFSQVMEGKTVFLPLLPAGLPDHAVEERQLCRTHGLRSVVAVPLRIGMGVIGLIAFQFVKQPCNWRPDVVSRLRLIGEVFANALVRKYSEQALRKSESRFRTLFEDAPVAIGIGRDGLQLHANRAYLKLFGYQRTEEVLDRPIADFWAPEWRALIDQRARQRSHGLPVVSEYEAVAQRKNGSQFPASVLATAVELPDGRATLAFITDLTERKEAEEKLQDMRQQLTHVARLSTLGEMAAEMAHELNHPLYAILNYAKATRNVLAEEGPPDLDSVREWNEEIAGTAVSAAEVVKRLRAFARARRCAAHRVPHRTDRGRGRALGRRRAAPCPGPRANVVPHRLATGHGGQGADPAGPRQSPDQRHRRCEGPAGRPADHRRFGVARRWRAGGCRFRPRPRAAARNGGQDLRALHHHQAGRLGHGAEHRPHDCRGLRRSVVGGARLGVRRRVPLHPPC